MKTVYPPTNIVCGGYNNDTVDVSILNKEIPNSVKEVTNFAKGVNIRN